MGVAAGGPAQRTRAVLRCATSFSGGMPPRCGFEQRATEFAGLRPSQAILSGARCQSGAPGTPDAG